MSSLAAGLRFAGCTASKTRDLVGASGDRVGTTTEELLLNRLEFERIPSSIGVC